jgi:uncharacterized membrane protein
MKYLILLLMLIGWFALTVIAIPTVIVPIILFNETAWFDFPKHLIQKL